MTPRTLPRAIDEKCGFVPIPLMLYYKKLRDSILKMQGRLIIVCGLPGSGKTTHARQLEQRLRAIRFSPDEWLPLLGSGLWDSDLRARLEQLQWKLAQDLLPLGHTVVIEWGTWARSERDQLREGARSLGAAVELHFLDAPLTILWDRIRLRNAEAPPITLSDMITWESHFQRPSPDEMSLFDGHV